MTAKVSGDIPARSSIHNMLTQQASIKLAEDRLHAKPKGGDAQELVWVADKALQQHRSKPVSHNELYKGIEGRQYLIGLLIASMHKTTPGGAWWKTSRVPENAHPRGFYCLPEVGDEVLVAFEHGDLRRPYVIGSLWNQKESPPDSKATTKKPARKQTHSG